ncbi:cation:proton antiporter [Dokdonella sp.]|uniref:cation:proton antiporter n=1 Tax=Dokdonella sp. TaxID=2291710 RepID=UPI003C41E439
MSGLIQVVVVCSGILLWALVSRRLSATLISMPMIFVLFGYAIGGAGADVLGLRVNSSLLHHFAEFTLILVLFTDASGVRLSELRRSFALPARMLLIGMPLTMLLGMFVAHWVSPAAPLPMALLIAAILTPTDAALAQAILSNKDVPDRVRQAINVESGLNDGLAVPVIILAATLSASLAGSADTGAPDSLAMFILLQLLLGPLVGIAIGYLLARLVDLAVDRDSISDAGRAISVLAGALLAFAVAEVVGGNGFISAFLAGLTLGNTLRCRREFIIEFMESEGQILTILTFVMFGAVLLPIGLQHATWKTVVLALLFITVVRMLPIWVSLIGTGLRPLEKLSLGWFGPRGLASILFVLLIDEQYTIPRFDEILACVVLTVLFSIFLHGASAVPLAGLFGRLRGQRRE